MTISRKKAKIILLLFFVLFPFMKQRPSSAAEVQLKFSPSTLELSDPISINNTSAFQEVSSKGSGSATDPFVIENLRIIGSANVSCIEIKDTNDHFIIKNCHLSNSTEFGFGIRLKRANNGRIQRCKIENCTVGIVSSSSQSVEIVGCNIIDNIGGMSLSHCSLFNVIGNRIMDTVSGAGVGLLVHEAANVQIENNIIHGFSVGIHSNYGLVNTVRNNTILENAFGFQLWACSNWKIYNNSIGWNDIPVVAGYGSYNYWNHTGIGNSWSDYDGNGVYRIDKYNTDYLPSQLNPSQPVFGDAPEIEYVFGDSGIYLEWDVSDPFPYIYEISKSADTVKAGYWNGGNVRIPVDGLAVGNHTYSLTVSNLLGFSRTQEATVIVLRPENPPLLFVFLLIFSIALPISGVLVWKQESLNLTKERKQQLQGIFHTGGIFSVIVVATLFLQLSAFWYWMEESIVIFTMLFGFVVNAITLWTSYARKGDGLVSVTLQKRTLSIFCEKEGVDADFQRELISMDGTRRRVYYVSLLVKNEEKVAAENCIAKISVWLDDGSRVIRGERLGWKSRGLKDAVQPITIGAKSHELINICTSMKREEESHFSFTTEKFYQGNSIQFPEGTYRLRTDVVADGFEPVSREFIVIKRQRYNEFIVEPSD